MHKALLMLIMLTLSVPSGVWAKDGRENQTRLNPDIAVYHGGEEPATKNAPKSGMVDGIKKQKLAMSTSRTIGYVFDGYRHFANKEWAETRLLGGKSYVTFTGWEKPGIFSFFSKKAGKSKRGIEVLFVVYPTGDFGVAMVSKVEISTDGKINKYPQLDQKGILEKIYANKEIRF